MSMVFFYADALPNIALEDKKTEGISPCEIIAYETKSCKFCYFP